MTEQKNFTDNGELKFYDRIIASGIIE